MHQKAALQRNAEAEASLSVYYSTSGEKRQDLVESYKWIILTKADNPKYADAALNAIKTFGITFSSQQMAKGQQRAEDFIRTNKLANCNSLAYQFGE